MTATSSEYRLVDVVTSEEQLRFRLTDDLDDDDDYTPVIEISRDGKWKVPDDGYIATSLYVKTMDGTVDCERVGKPYSQS